MVRVPNRGPTDVRVNTPRGGDVRAITRSVTYEQTTPARLTAGRFPDYTVASVFLLSASSSPQNLPCPRSYRFALP